MFYIKHGTARVHDGWHTRHFRGRVNGKMVSGVWWFVGSQWTREQPAMPAPPPLDPKYIAFIAACIASPL
jgi:hypothetical protein